MKFRFIKEGTAVRKTKLEVCGVTAVSKGSLSEVQCLSYFSICKGKICEAVSDNVSA